MLGEGEEFDQGCLCVGDVDNSGSGHGESGADEPPQQEPSSETTGISETAE